MTNAKRSGIVHWHITVPSGLGNSIDLRLFDPLRGRVRYGARSGLIEELLTKWLQAETTGGYVAVIAPETTETTETTKTTNEHTS